MFNLVSVRYAHMNLFRLLHVKSYATVIILVIILTMQISMKRNDQQADKCGIPKITYLLRYLFVYFLAYISFELMVLSKMWTGYFVLD